MAPIRYRPSVIFTPFNLRLERLPILVGYGIHWFGTHSKQIQSQARRCPLSWPPDEVPTICRDKPGSRQPAIPFREAGLVDSCSLNRQTFALPMRDLLP